MMRLLPSLGRSKEIPLGFAGIFTIAIPFSPWYGVALAARPLAPISASQCSFIQSWHYSWRFGFVEWGSGRGVFFMRQEPRITGHPLFRSACLCSVLLWFAAVSFPRRLRRGGFFVRRLLRSETQPYSALVRYTG